MPGLACSTGSTVMYCETQGPYLIMIFLVGFVCVCDALEICLFILQKSHQIGLLLKMDGPRGLNLHLQLIFFELEKQKPCSGSKLGEAKGLFSSSFLHVSLQGFTFSVTT